MLNFRSCISEVLKGCYDIRLRRQAWGTARVPCPLLFAYLIRTLKVGITWVKIFQHWESLEWYTEEVLWGVVVTREATLDNRFAEVAASSFVDKWAIRPTVRVIAPLNALGLGCRLSSSKREKEIEKATSGFQTRLSTKHASIVFSYCARIGVCKFSVRVNPTVHAYYIYGRKSHCIATLV